MIEITGKTKLFALVADPILQAKTPQAVNKLLAQRGVDGVMVPMHVPPEALPAFVAALRGMLNFCGMVVTVPHKTAIVQLCDEVTPAAALVGAVNVVRREQDGRIVGDILDGQGFMSGLCQHGIDVKGKNVFLAGAGGAANAIAFALADAGVERLTIYNRTGAKAHAMIARLSKAYPGVKIVVGTDNPAGNHLVVNATSLGMVETDAMPLVAGNLTADQIVAEIIMTPALTPLLAAAQSRGCRIHYGAPMLECQVELMVAFMGIGK
jgi:shikimate dehydrogenase